MTILPIHLPYQIFKLIANFASLSSHQINDLRVIREEQATVQRWTSFVAILQPQVLPDRAWTALTGTCSHASLETHDITQLTYITIIICYFLQYAVTLILPLLLLPPPPPPPPQLCCCCCCCCRRSGELTRLP